MHQHFHHNSATSEAMLLVPWKQVDSETLSHIDYGQNLQLEPYSGTWENEGETQRLYFEMFQVATA